MSVVSLLYRKLLYSFALALFTLAFGVAAYAQSGSMAVYSGSTKIGTLTYDYTSAPESPTKLCGDTGNQDVISTTYSSFNLVVGSTTYPVSGTGTALYCPAMTGANGLGFTVSVSSNYDPGYACTIFVSTSYTQPPSGIGPGSLPARLRLPRASSTLNTLLWASPTHRPAQAAMYSTQARLHSAIPPRSPVHSRMRWDSAFQSREVLVVGGLEDR